MVRFASADTAVLPLVKPQLVPRYKSGDPKRETLIKQARVEPM